MRGRHLREWPRVDCLQGLETHERRGVHGGVFHFAARTVNGSRSGFSLIEVIIATAILMGSAIVLARLAGMGRDQAQKAKLHSNAQQVCEQTMNELLLGLRPLELVESMPLIPLPQPVEELSDEMIQQELFAMPDTAPERVVDETNAEWNHSIRTELLPNIPGMWNLTVEVVQGDETLPRPIRFSLTRWIAGPPPEGAFDELSRGLNEPQSLLQGDLL
jgi:type II secretory pathway pseudopilin PulG